MEYNMIQLDKPLEIGNNNGRRVRLTGEVSKKISSKYVVNNPVISNERGYEFLDINKVLGIVRQRKIECSGSKAVKFTQALRNKYAEKLNNLILENEPVHQDDFVTPSLSFENETVMPFNPSIFESELPAVDEQPLLNNIENEEVDYPSAAVPFSLNTDLVTHESRDLNTNNNYNTKLETGTLDINEIIGKASSVTARISSLTDENDSLKSEINELKNELKMIKDEKTALNETISSQVRTIEDLKNEKLKIQGENDTLRAENSNKDGIISELQGKYNSSMDALKEISAALGGSSVTQTQSRGLVA